MVCVGSVSCIALSCLHKPYASNGTFKVQINSSKILNFVLISVEDLAWVHRTEKGPQNEALYIKF